MMRKHLATAILVASVLAVTGLPSRAEEDNSAALAKALVEATVLLDQGLKASEHEGKPISAKYELNDGALQLSVYTMKGNTFAEVVVDHKSGAIKKAEAITDPDDLKAATEQGQIIAKTKLSLDQAVGDAVKANPDYRAVSVVPTLSDGQPVATVTLMKGSDVKKVMEKLD